MAEPRSDHCATKASPRYDRDAATGDLIPTPACPRCGMPGAQGITHVCLTAGIPSHVPCDHDWRVNPHLTLTSNPPKEELRCTKCGAVSYRTKGGYSTYSNDPKDWPHA